MKRTIIFSFLLLFTLVACNGATHTFNNGCIPPITSFAYLANRSPSRNLTQVLPSVSWQVEVSLPEIPSGSRAFDLVSIARKRDGNNEVWIKRQLYFETEGIPRVQFLIYNTKSKEWKLVPEKFDDKSAKSALIFLANDGTVWAELGFSGFSYFGLYNDNEEQFDYVDGSENMPQGNRLLDDNGKLWILARKDGIYSYNTVNHKVEKQISIPDLETSSSLFGTMAALAPDGSIYFLNMTGEQQVNLMHFDPKTGQLEFVPGLDYLGDTSYNLFMDRSGHLWFGDLGWMEPDGTWYRTLRSPVFLTDRAESANYIWSYPSIVLESSNGLLWFQSDNGLAWLDSQKGEWCWFTTEQSNIVEDQEHNLWMIADGKLYKNQLKP